MRCASLCLLVMVGACSSPPAAPDAAGPVLRIALPTIDLAPGQQRTICYYTSLPSDTPVAVRSWASSITNGAHGLQLFTTPTAIAPDGTVAEVCDFQGTANGDVARWLYQATIPEDSSDTPVGVAMPLAARQPLIVRMHVLNPTDVTQHVVSELRATLVREGEAYTAAGVLLAYRQNLMIRQNVVQIESGSCAAARGLQLYRMASFSLTQSNLVEAHDDSTQVYRSTDYAHPSEVSWQTTPHTVAGSLEYRCRYLNQSNLAMERGGVEGRDEACAIVAHYYPATADVICADPR